MNVLLLNLTRFGDLLQSQAAVNDLTSQGHRVGMVCLGNFAEAGQLVRGLSHVFPFKAALLLKTLDNRPLPAAAGPVSPSWPVALADLAAWRDELLRVFQPDVVCNLTPSLPARMLSLFLSGDAQRTGFTLDDRGYAVNGNAWADFLQGAAHSRGVSPFNVVDLFRRIATGQNHDAPPSPVRGNASLLPPPETTRHSMESLLRQHAPPGCKGFVALQLGASEHKRRWPVASFAALGHILWKSEGLCPVLLGSKEEIPLADSYASLSRHPFISLCGQTGLKELAAALCAARMLVTSDTGTMHLAAGLGIPVLAFFLATAQAFDTGPYLEGSCCLEPAMDCHPCAFGSVCPRELACRRCIGPDFAARLVLSRLRTGTWTETGPAPVPGSPARVWLSEYDDQGFMSLRSLSGHEAEPRTSWLMLQRHCIHPYLDQDGQEDFRPPSPPAAPFSVAEPEAARICATLTRAIALVELMLQQGTVLLRHPVPLMHDRFLASWKKIYACLRASPWCASLTLLWNRETQAEGLNLPTVLRRAERFAALLRALHQGVSSGN